MKRTATIAAALAIGGAAALSFFHEPFARNMAPAKAAATPRPAVWVETKWPFPMDQWGEGTAFRCKAADCGVELTVYLRTKFGFCSSTVGVNNDEELERLSNFDFMDGSFAAVTAGRSINVGWMKGRIRAYASPNRRASALIAAFNNDSDAMVATVLMAGGRADAVEPVIVDFLNDETVQRWAKSKLGM